MKRLLLTAPTAAVLMMFSGCGVSTGPFKSDDGLALTTPLGAPIVVVEQITPAPADSTASSPRSVQDYLADKAKAKAKPVEILRTDVELAQLVYEGVRATVIADIRKSIASASIKEMSRVVEFVDGRVQISERILTTAARAAQTQRKVEKVQPMTPGAIVALRALLEKEVTELLEKEFFPKVIAKTLADLEPRVNACVKEGKFAAARNLIWEASTTGIPPIDNPVREKAMYWMHGLVNPTNWKSVEPKIEAVFQKAMKDKTYDAGVKVLRDFLAKGLAEEYAALINRRLVAVKGELVKVGVAEKDMAAIFQKQAAIIAAAAKITDVCDEYLTLEDARKERKEKSARSDPALKEYYRRLDEFQTTLVRFNCTKENVEQIVVNLDRDLLALINMLRKPATFDVTEKGEVRSLQLGTRSLNDRIRAMVNDRIARLLKQKADDARAAFVAKLKSAKDDLTEKVKALVAESKFEEARELIWNASITGNAEWDTDMFAHGLMLLRDLVNPKDWERIDADITENYNKLKESASFEELKKFLEEYPLIRQHTVKLDDQLARVRAEAEALGADPEKAAAVVQDVCQRMVTEAEALVDHLDQLVANGQATGEGVDMTKFQKELEVYAAKLASYHATEANVAQIVEKLKVELGKLIATPENPATTRLVLGTNAVNDRIRKRIAELLATLAKDERGWQDAEYLRLATDLEKRVRKAVGEQRFGDARDYIRDEKRVGREDLDIRLYELRVGLLDSCVNPAQLDFLLAEIDAKMKAFLEAEDYAGAQEYAENYPYVHDQYEQIEVALTAVKNAMVALEIPPKESEYDEKVRFFNAIQELLEKRRESWKPERDLSAIEKALAEVAKALFDHLNKHPDAIKDQCQAEYAHILEDLAKLDRTITTWELNERLRAHLDSYFKSTPEKPGINDLKIAQDNRKLLVQVDEEVSFDSQIAMAEEAISRQLGVKAASVTFKVNALLGEYARVFRLLKKGEDVKPDWATTMLLGGAYLDQAQVVAYALKLGAKINGVSPRDPRGRTALALAIDAGHSALVKPLVEAGASLVAVDKDGNAIVHYAAKSGNLTVLKVVTATAPVNVKNNDGDTPLAIAVKRNQAAVVEFITAAEPEKTREAFVNSKNAKGETAFDVAAICGSRDVLDALAKAGATYGAHDLAYAGKFDHVAIAQWLVNQGVDVNAPGVMDDVCPLTQTGRYLFGEGAIATGHTCEVCNPPPKLPEAPVPQVVPSEMAETPVKAAQPVKAAVPATK